MKQQSLGSGFEKYARTTKRARFLEQMDQVMPWSSLCAVIEPFYFKDTGSGGRPPMALERMLRIYFLQGLRAFGSMVSSTARLPIGRAVLRSCF